MILATLILSHDERAVRLLKLLLSELSVKVEHETDFERAKERISLRKFDGIFAECEEEHGPELLKSVKRSKHNKRSIVFAISTSPLKLGFAFELGAHFVIQKPLAVEKVKRTLKAAHGLMMREQRAHFRHPTAAPVTMKVGNGSPFNASLRDLTQNGAMIESGSVLQKGQSVTLRFALPETSTLIETTGTVSWSDATGRAGIRFEALAESTEKELAQWVINRSFEADPQGKLRPERTSAATRSPLIPDLSEPLDIEVEIIEPQEASLRKVRSALRAQHHAAIKVLAFNGTRPIIVNGRCTNLSEVGLAADLEEELSVKSQVLIQLTLPGAESSLVIHGQVRHREDTRYGFEFIGLDEGTKKFLEGRLEDLTVE